MLYAIPTEVKTIPQENRDDWVHPEITRFLNHLDEFDHMPYFEVDWNKYVLVGWSVPQSPKIDAAQQILGSVVFLANLSFKGIAMALFGSAAKFGVQSFLEGARPGVKAFAVSFAKPKEWDSNDDDFWRDVMDFFHVKD
jgi:hypothetical protein